MKKVNIVGSGIVGLLSAYYLSQAGFKISVFDSGPNPLTDYNKDKAGATFSGGNARHVSATETSPHASSSMTRQIYIRGDKGGWLAKDVHNLTLAEKAWMDEFELVTQSPELFTQFTKTVIEVNNLGKDLWRKLMIQDPDLFTNVQIQQPLTVFFLDESTFKSEKNVETAANPLYPPRPLTKKEIIKEYPVMADAVRRKIIAGGLVLDGFALNAISFCANIIRRLLSQGVSFSWDTEVTSSQKLDPAEYYLISTGARKQDFLTGTSSHQKIMGVAGVWITIPNPGLKEAFKVACPYPTGYINGTLEGKNLLLSGGYGFIGQDYLDRQNPGIQTLFEDMKRNVQSVFPESFKKALREDSLDERVCVRPMKPSGLGVFEIMKKGKSKVIFTGANSAGGFTQAPVLAAAVLDTLNGKDSFLIKAFSQDKSLSK